MSTVDYLQYAIPLANAIHDLDKAALKRLLRAGDDILITPEYWRVVRQAGLSEEETSEGAWGPFIRGVAHIRTGLRSNCRSPHNPSVPVGWRFAKATPLSRCVISETMLARILAHRCPKARALPLLRAIERLSAPNVKAAHAGIDCIQLAALFLSRDETILRRVAEDYYRTIDNHISLPETKPGKG